MIRKFKSIEQGDLFVETNKIVAFREYEGNVVFWLNGMSEEFTITDSIKEFMAKIYYDPSIAQD